MATSDVALLLCQQSLFPPPLSPSQSNAEGFPRGFAHTNQAYHAASRPVHHGSCVGAKQQTDARAQLRAPLGTRPHLDAGVFSNPALVLTDSGARAQGAVAQVAPVAQQETTVPSTTAIVPAKPKIDCRFGRNALLTAALLTAALLNALLKVLCARSLVICTAIATNPYTEGSGCIWCAKPTTPDEVTRSA